MKTKHTPGPWTLKQTGDGKAIMINNGFIGEVYSDDIDSEEALKKALPYMEVFMIRNEEPLVGENLKTDLFKVREAIKKATE